MKLRPKIEQLLSAFVVQVKAAKGEQVKMSPAVIKQLTPAEVSPAVCYLHKAGLTSTGGGYWYHG